MITKLQDAWRLLVTPYRTYFEYYLEELVRNPLLPTPAEWDARCKKSYYSAIESVQGYVYLMHLEGTFFYKIGRSIDPEFRLQTVSLAALPMNFKNNVPEIKIIHVIETNEMFQLERELHTRYSSQRVGSHIGKDSTEWFALSAEQVQEVTSRDEIYYYLGQDDF